MAISCQVALPLSLSLSFTYIHIGTIFLIFGNHSAIAFMLRYSMFFVCFFPLSLSFSVFLSSIRIFITNIARRYAVLCIYVSAPL